MSERLYEAAPQPKRLHWIEGAGHGNWGNVGLADYGRAVHEFVEVSRSLARERPL
jgi:hypothetical protein